MTATKTSRLTHHQARAIAIGALLTFDGNFDADFDFQDEVEEAAIRTAVVIDNDVRENGTLQVLVNVDGRQDHRVQWIDYRAILSLRTHTVWQLVDRFDTDKQTSWPYN